MLPFLKRKAADQAGAVVVRAPDNPEIHADPNHEALEACAADIIACIKAGDHKALAVALKDTFDILDVPADEAEESKE